MSRLFNVIIWVLLIVAYSFLRKVRILAIATGSCLQVNQ